MPLTPTKNSYTIEDIKSLPRNLLLPDNSSMTTNIEQDERFTIRHRVGQRTTSYTLDKNGRVTEACREVTREITDPTPRPIRERMLIRSLEDFIDQTTAQDQLNSLIELALRCSGSP